MKIIKLNNLLYIAIFINCLLNLRNLYKFTFNREFSIEKVVVWQSQQGLFFSFAEIDVGMYSGPFTNACPFVNFLKGYKKQKRRDKIKMGVKKP